MSGLFKPRRRIYIGDAEAVHVERIRLSVAAVLLRLNPFVPKLDPGIIDNLNLLPFLP